MKETRKLFRQKVYEHGGPAAVARMLKCSRTYIYMIIADRHPRRPGQDLQYAIETLFGIPMQAWRDPPPARRKPKAA